MSCRRRFRPGSTMVVRIYHYQADRGYLVSRRRRERRVEPVIPRFHDPCEISGDVISGRAVERPGPSPRTPLPWGNRCRCATREVGGGGAVISSQPEPIRPAWLGFSFWLRVPESFFCKTRPPSGPQLVRHGERTETKISGREKDHGESWQPGSRGDVLLWSRQSDG